MEPNGDKEVLGQKRSRIWKNIIIILFILFLFILILGVDSMTLWVDYRQRSYNSAAFFDLRDACEWQEEYYVDNETYADSIHILIEYCSGFQYGFQPSENVVIYVVSADESHYKMEAYHLAGDFLYEVTGPNGTLIKYEWKNQVKGKMKSIIGKRSKIID